MKLVDFVVEEPDQTLLIEVKDPSQSAATVAGKKSFTASMLHDGLINNRLVPKARDSYTFLHLMERDKKRFLFVVLLGLEALKNERALLMGFKDRLLGRIRHEAREPWRRYYVDDCVVVTLETWPDHFPDYVVSRTVS